MAKTHSTTKTKTCTRIVFVLNHFRSALKRLTTYNDREIKKILNGIETEEIESLSFLGYVSESNKKDVYVRLRLSVDWDEHHHLKNMSPVIEYENKFDEETCPEIYGLIMLVHDTINDKKLESCVMYTYSEHIKNNSSYLTSARKKYGTAPSEIDYDYSRLKHTEQCHSPEAYELSAKCEIRDLYD